MRVPEWSVVSADRRAGRRTGLFLLCFALAWLLLRGYADYLARVLPERALALNAAQPEALLRRAEGALRAGDTAAAEAAALRALATRPDEGRALRVLGAVAERRGDRARALGLMGAAALVTPRDSATQFWLAINALADHDLDTSLRKLDRLLRFEPELHRDVFPILGTIASNPVGAQAIAGYLAGDPPWRSAFMTTLMRQIDNHAVLARLLRAIERAGGRIAPAEHAQVAEGLWRAHDWRRLRAWLGRREGGIGTAWVRDPGFDGPALDAWSGWEVGRVGGVDILLGAVLDERRGLRLIFLDRRVPFRHVSQRLLLLPGHYVLRISLRLRQLRSALGLRWTLRCAESNVEIATTERLLGDGPWRVVQTAFEVPPQACGGQVLQLQLDARIDAERLISGEAWFDQLMIESDEARPDSVSAETTR
ncbi:MAG: hypothetical protein IT479_16040 [Xanthomonadales bacterium]|nr:hypothetical protein [Xanthomonadales bacterium]MCC6594773.1 hypothetical protein [Xanthomonadales bacterium]MCE7931735.1 hypothetical protein [Xanthomonadales bacterium PRO6]